jgi:hypothetical protein
MTEHHAKDEHSHEHGYEPEQDRHQCSFFPVAPTPSAPIRGIPSAPSQPRLCCLLYRKTLRDPN